MSHWKLIREKRDWCPEWLFSVLAPIAAAWPLNWILTRKV